MECDATYSHGPKRRRPSLFENYDANEPEQKRIAISETIELTIDDERLAQTVYATHESSYIHASATNVNSNQTSTFNTEKQYICFGTVRGFPLL